MSKEYESERLISHPEGSSLPNEMPVDTTEHQTRQRNIVLIAILILSIVINILQVTVRASIPWHASHAKQSDYRSQYAGLRNNEVSVEWGSYWDAINHDSGIVAVTKLWALKQGLPLGSRFPWDTNKTIYLVNAYHALHCVKNIYKSFMEYRMGIEQSLSHHHIIHCLD
ncbi:4ef172a3-944c-4a1c-aa14-aae148dba021 [Sclerotinia trifoliorum]|uniref:4ef172a3-944c-4a1c-aa14-aae148dba021 n=1 Tax=Sclerotinia trifoliorum TaxID=28548 RepID=A0A8H2VQD4_9HELO|nr:4ef172a3-944c-4a1c-aa14-aae148dba021 [Sclerotinia trifoliorum]